MSAERKDCKICFVLAIDHPNAHKPEWALTILFAFLRAGFDPKEMHRELCFKHRRSVERAVAEATAD